MKYLVMITLLLCMSIYAEKYSVGLNAGVKGIGLDGTMKLSDTFVLKGSVDFNTFLSFSGTTDSEEPIDYDADLSQFSLGVLIDWHPLENGFKLSGGLYYLNYEIDGTGKAAETYSFGSGIGEVTYTPEDLGNVNVDGNTGSIAPYIGLGYNGVQLNGGGIGFNFDLGVLYVGAPDFSVNSTEMIRHTEEELEPLLNEELEQFQFLPVMTFGIVYSF
ncbi:MAG: hypothetical protein JXR48_03480 [Candidatus Delongbacteria bacterium]|nr:hypothetical protein [Candidatus Delongbacteria bacterium]MBN2834008.1 hypothetical protein [Candidatus Delongbacteria bacterium]